MLTILIKYLTTVIRNTDHPDSADYVGESVFLRTGGKN